MPVVGDRTYRRGAPPLGPEFALHVAALDGQDAGLSDRDRAFYQGKLATSRFFAQTVLPRLTVERRAVEDTTLELMELPVCSKIALAARIFVSRSTMSG